LNFKVAEGNFAEGNWVYFGDFVAFRLQGKENTINQQSFSHKGGILPP
jgi:hypothetical protein